MQIMLREARWVAPQFPDGFVVFFLVFVCLFLVLFVNISGSKNKKDLGTVPKPI